MGFWIMPILWPWWVLGGIISVLVIGELYLHEEGAWGTVARVLVWAIPGAVLGLMAVRELSFTFADHLIWAMLWDGVNVRWGVLLISTFGAKCAAGIFGGGAITALIGASVSKALKKK